MNCDTCGRNLPETSFRSALAFDRETALELRDSDGALVTYPVSSTCRRCESDALQARYASA